MSNLLSSHTNFTPKSIYCKNVYKDCDETSFGLILLKNYCFGPTLLKAKNAAIILLNFKSSTLQTYK